MRLLPIQGVLGHALLSTKSNLRFAWHISWPWLAVLVPLHLLVEPQLPKIVPDAVDPATVASNTQAVVGLMGLGLVSLLVFSSIAVAWHRYILTDEVPQGLARFRLDSVVWRYLGNTILVGLLISLAMVPVVLLASMFIVLTGLSPTAASIVVAVLAGVIALPLAYRMMIKLPAIAVGNPDISFKVALQKTAGNSVQLGIAAVIIFGAILLIGFALAQVLSVTGAERNGATSMISIVVQQVVGWITTIFTVTFLTSLYGFFVEERDF